MRGPSLSVNEQAVLRGRDIVAVKQSHCRGCIAYLPGVDMRKKCDDLPICIDKLSVAYYPLELYVTLRLKGEL